MNHSCFSMKRAPLALLLSVIILSGCSIPRIIVLNDPLSVEEHNKLGGIYESQGKFDLAAQQYRDALSKEPGAVSSLLLLGELSFRTKNYAEAESAYQKVIQLQPGNGDAYNNLCWVYLAQNERIEKAEELVRKAISSTPEHRPYYLDTWGMVLLRLGRTAEAVTVLREAIGLLPEDNADYLAEAHLHLAEAYRAAGDEENAREEERNAQRYRAGK